MTTRRLGLLHELVSVGPSPFRRECRRQHSRSCRDQCVRHGRARDVSTLAAMTTRGKSILFVPAFALSLMLGACGEDRPERAVTVEPQDGDSQETNDGSAGEGDEPADTAGEPLTQKQINAALLRVQDMPSGWAKEKNEPDDDSDDKIQPARCQEVMETLDKGTDDKPLHEGEVTFSNGGAFGTTFSESLSTFKDEIDDDAAQKIADAFGSCPEFTSIDSEGSKSKISLSPMSFANLGDQTLAFALTVNSEGFEIKLNLAMVVVGHNLATFFSGGLTGASGSELEKLARKGLERLESVTS